MSAHLTHPWLKQVYRTSPALEQSAADRLAVLRGEREMTKEEALYFDLKQDQQKEFLDDV